MIIGRSRDEPRRRRPIGVSFFAAGIAAVGGIKTVGECARNFLLGLHAGRILYFSFLFRKQHILAPLSI